MTPTPYPSLRRALAAGLIPLVLGLWGCGAAPPKEPVAVQPPKEVTPPPTGISLELPPSDFSDVFSRVEQQLDGAEWMAAEASLSELPRDSVFTSEDGQYLVYLQARIAYIRGDHQQALRELGTLNRASVYPSIRYRALDLSRQIESLAGNDMASARLGASLLPMAPAPQSEGLRRDIWRDLQRTGSSELNAALAGETDTGLRGWFELASLVRGDYPGGEEIELWRATNPQHPAAQPLPGGMDYLLENYPPPQRVALILPLSGRLAPAGKAVRDGYLANFYAARAAGLAGFDLVVLDQDRYPDANAAYDDAVLQGAGLVVGPLSKKAVTQLAQRLDRSVPVLALNRGNGTQPGSGAPLVQLSLSPEDEAARLAEFAFGQGARRALVIRPANTWGDKVEQALAARWTALGGSFANRVAYDKREDHSPTVKEALDIPASERRARGVRDMLATNIEFTARRRQDVDVLFLLAANSADARSLKPLLAFHYAGDIPVYSTSAVYSGLPDERNRDLNGINLVETPWLLGASPSLRVAIAAGDTGSDSYTRLNALGADAFLMQWNFPRLQAGPDALLRGNTGLLSMDPGQRIHRDLPLATFEGGEVAPR
jgi:outer membrane PBP1 activator LpoA protein